MYVAKHYVRVNGVIYTRGEIIESDLPAEKAERLLRLNAIEEIGTQNTVPQPEPASEPNTEKQEQPEPASEPKKAEETEQQPEPDNPIPEQDDPIPEINITDGIVDDKTKPKKKKGAKK